MSGKPIEQLNTLLADYMVLYQKLRNYHWNVKGPLFFGLHEVFEQQYVIAAQRVDDLAERVGAMGGRPISTLKEHLDQTRLQEDTTVPQAKDMVRNLLRDFESLTQSLRAEVKNASDRGDTATVNLLESYSDDQEKTAWMLRAFLED